jgi:hypothetical protein
LQQSASSTPQTANNASRLSKHKKSKKKEQGSEEHDIKHENIDDKKVETQAPSEMPSEEIQTCSSF